MTDRETRADQAAEACDIAWVEYRKAKIAAAAEQERLISAARLACGKATEAAQDQYSKAILAYWNEYNRIKAAAWAKVDAP